MYSKSVKKGLFLVTLTGALLIPGDLARAADIEQGLALPSAGIEAVLNDCYATNEDIKVEQYLVPTFKGEYLDMAFADVTSFLYIRSAPTKESEWVGKLYPGYAAKIAGPVGEWTAVKSGTVTGYVKTEYILTGMEAEKKAQEVVAQVTEETQEAEKFTYAESREEEEIRLAEEARIAAEEAEKEAARLAEEAATKQGSGQAIVDYACQFIGNPYVWGGTSLTNGADCSGFIQSVYAHFGINMPRTSGEMRSAGFGVSYDEAIAGDVICYDGHVGIYMGNGEIVNARNPAKGIGISPATYKGIITVRRML